MKRTLRWFFSVVIMLAVAIPAFSAHGVSSQNNKSKIFSYLTVEIGFNTAAACGIMANMEHECGFNPSRVMYDSNGLLSGGLCMWNGSRFYSLQRFCNNKGYNYVLASLIKFNNNAKILVHCERTPFGGETESYIRTTLCAESQVNAPKSSQTAKYTDKPITGCSFQLPSGCKAGTKYTFWGVDRN